MKETFTGHDPTLPPGTPVEPVMVTIVIENAERRTTISGLQGTVDFELDWYDPATDPDALGFSSWISVRPRILQSATLSVTNIQHDGQYEWLRLQVEEPTGYGLFVPLSPTSGKLQCTVCGRSGWPGVGPTHWSAACRKGHPYECDACGRKFPTKGSFAAHLRRHGGAS